MYISRYSSAKGAFRIGATGLALASACLVGAARPDERSEAEFERRVRPILVAHCMGCHGEKQPKGGLRIDSRASLLKGGAHGPAVVPGRAPQSLLMTAVRRTGSLKMPPGAALTADEVSVLEKWVTDGAVWPSPRRSVPSGTSTRGHWSFQPVRRVSPPTVRDRSWVRDPIDAFVLSKWEANGQKPSPPADRRTLLRRVTYDLTGLPPTPVEVEAFVRDASPRAYEAVVDRLLASPRYGEKWGRHWLDVVRYADTAGENSDHPLPHAWRYRNWVINALNSNMPYDAFLKRQIAGDLLAAQGPPERYADDVVATGFLAIARRFGHEIDKDIHLTYEDAIDTVGKSMLGLTLGCARCHDHKFDPISARDYYGIYGILASTKLSFPGCEPQQQPRDLVPLVSPVEMERSIKPIQQEAARLDAEGAKLGEALPGLGRSAANALAKSRVIVSNGEIPDGGSARFSGKGPLPTRLSVKKGDVLQLSVSPMGNHGADTTCIEWTIAETGGTRQWSVTDLLDDLPAANPHADRLGNKAVWCFLDAQDGLLVMPENSQSIEGLSDLQAWRTSDTPSVLVNRANRDIKVWTTLPARSFYVHPGPKGSVAVAWLSPIDGEIEVTGRIVDAHPGGGDGVGWLMEHFTGSPGTPPAGRYRDLAEKTAALQSLRSRRVDLLKQIRIPVGFAAFEGEAKDAAIQRRGDPADTGEVVPRKFLDVLGGQRLRNPRSSGRLELADWIASNDNPLTARVFVNRVWQHHFGRGLVGTPNDFGTRGLAPSHPDLLDWLAVKFMADGWNIKALQRSIVLSATYRQSGTAEAADTLAGHARRRLSAEEVRDTLLAASGELDLTPGEAHPFPPESGWLFSQHAPFAAEYPTTKRSVYIMQKRNRRDRFFALFDGADPNASTGARYHTTVPTQALYFMNDPFVLARASKLAERIAAGAPSDDARLDFACRLLYGRPTTADDRRDFASFRASCKPGDEASVWQAYARVMLASSELLYVD